MIWAALAGASNRKRMSQDNFTTKSGRGQARRTEHGRDCLSAMGILGPWFKGNRPQARHIAAYCRRATEVGVQETWYQVALRSGENPRGCAGFRTDPGGRQVDTSLVYEILELPSSPRRWRQGAIGEGRRRSRRSRTWQSRQPESQRDSGMGKLWPEPSHPIAKFFGGENRLSIWQRIAIIVMIAMGAGAYLRRSPERVRRRIEAFVVSMMGSSVAGGRRGNICPRNVSHLQKRL